MLRIALIVLLHSLVGMAVDNNCASCVAGVKDKGDKNTPRLYHKPRGSSVGSIIYSMLHAASFASLKGWAYGGPAEIATEDLYAINFIFNTKGYFQDSIAALKGGNAKKLEVAKASELSAVSGPPWSFTQVVAQQDDWAVLEKKCPTEPFPRFKYSDDVPVLDKLFNPVFLREVQKSNQVSLSYTKSHFKTDGRAAPRVAIHIRRGIVAKGSYANRKHTLDAYYFSIIEIIRSVYPKAEIHGFPTVGMKAGAPALNQTEYAGFTKRNVTLHFEADLLHAWAHMISADVFVMAHSVYSSIPALLNTHCVVYDHFWLGKLKRHVTIHSLKEHFRKCYKPQIIEAPAKGRPMMAATLPFTGPK
jgi:hypothetical protein